MFFLARERADALMLDQPRRPARGEENKREIARCIERNGLNFFPLTVVTATALLDQVGVPILFVRHKNFSFAAVPDDAHAAMP